MTPVDGNSLLGQARANLTTTIGGAASIITNDDLPTLMADGTQLAQVFQNLLHNAILFANDWNG